MELRGKKFRISRLFHASPAIQFEHRFGFRGIHHQPELGSLLHGKVFHIQSFFVNLAEFTPQLSQQQTAALGLPYQGSGQQTTVTYQCKFAYAFFPYLSAELGWSYTSYGSYFDLNNGNGGSYTRNQVYLGLRGTY